MMQHTPTPAYGLRAPFSRSKRAIRSQKRVALVVEDDQSSRDSLAAALDDMGLRVVCAANGAEAIRRLGDADFDIIISDLMMPEVDGLDLLAHVRNRCPATPFVLVTAADSWPTAVQAVEWGAFALLPKPIDLVQLEAVIGQAA